MINHVLIPTSTEQKTLQVFSKDECETTRHDYCLVDVLTAATAAPTYFPAFRVDGIQHDLMDGGLLANNPARLAYNHAVNDLNKDKNDIYVISLGTGIDIGSVFNEKKSNSVLFWAQNISDFMIESHQNAIDQEMNDLIGDRYIKLQAYFSKPISLDACGKIGDLENIGKQVIEENTKLIDDIIKILQN
ncbi:patatin family [Brachionus plicatilis]|uniref:Patatin family n=1 Tax=Brachionus plicatilis TaxID=10195 RepID=A0A3M7PDU5_BRAPC|nr:patatin family [Brachionus plicatilis]